MNSDGRGQCANCGATLTGPYCASCGQHVHESARTLGALLHEAWHLMTHLDGRLWRTMYTLLLRPGRLTQEYFAARRARYLPPVRLYLVLSLVFFAVSSPGPREANETRAVLPQSDSNALDAPEAHRSARTLGEPDGFIVDTTHCSAIKSAFKWLEAPLRRACERTATSGGAPVRTAFLANIPKMMFVFLPMMALVMLLLYWQPRHYYVEHLVFFLHTHAAMFLILLLERPLSWVIATLPTVFGILKFGAGVYALWYVYRAMRVYYGQSRWITCMKLIVVGWAYTVFLTLTLLATLVFSALAA